MARQGCWSQLWGLILQVEEEVVDHVVVLYIHRTWVMVAVVVLILLLLSLPCTDDAASVAAVA